MNNKTLFKFMVAASSLAFSMAASAQAMYVDPVGNVGVGTGAPTEAIDVLRVDAGARLKLTAITSTANEAPQMVWRRARSNGGVDDAVGVSDNLGAFSFRGHDGDGFTGSRAFINVAATENWTPGSTGTTMVFQVTPNGTSVLTEVFRVNAGELRVTGNVIVDGTTLNVPDYVFEEDYELMSLDQLAAFIDINKHLPGVASAKEVNSKGLNLAGSQLSVLEKVEELTLYTLQQHEDLKKMSALQSAHTELLAAYHSQQEQLAMQKAQLASHRAELDKIEHLEQVVNQLIQARDGKSVYTSLK